MLKISLSNKGLDYFKMLIYKMFKKKTNPLTEGYGQSTLKVYPLGNPIILVKMKCPD
jgi:hypothetical protein